MHEFELLKYPLKTGSAGLIEASAGTGKTTALENLVLRLLLEGVEQPDGSFKEVTLPEILVVTFTEAATAELIQRVRENIAAALRLLRNQMQVDGKNMTGVPAEEITDIPCRLLVNYIKNSRNPVEAIKMAAYRLRLALLSFDESAISTIHGFCYRMLNEFAFESGLRFDLELIDDDSEFIQETADDFWRSTFYAEERKPIAQAASASGMTPQTLVQLLRDTQKAPFNFLQSDPQSLEDMFTNLNRNIEKLAEMSESSETLNLLVANTSNFTAAFRRKLEQAIQLLIEAPKKSHFMDILSVLPVFDQEKAGEALKKNTNWTGLNDCSPGNGKLPEDFIPFFELSYQTLYMFEQLTVKLKINFLRSVTEKGILKKKKNEHGVQSFDDLLKDMHSAVVNSKTFAEKIRARYPVVMIDEFQDTDPLQFEIFQGIFNDPKSLMIMVGDPKQSIYAFRGADIYSYLQVSESLPESSKSTLNRNFRSSENLLNAFNLLFDRTDPFIEKSIRFLPAVAGREQSRLIIADDNVEEKPFKLWELKNADGTSVNKTTATDKASSAVRTRIAQILTMAEQTDGQGRPQARFEFSDGESKPVKAADIAVLTDTKAQAQQVCEKLNAAGIPAVLQHTGNIFEAEEASALFHTLNAIASPGNTRALKTALSTVLFQFDLQYIASLDDEENSNELEFWQGTLHNLLDLWLKEGFIQMFFRMLRPEKEDGAQPDLLLKKDVRSNMLSLPQGERHLTDLLHLGELIHQEALQRKLGVAGVISWLQNQITHPGNSEEFERRLESDEDAVKIMTVHKSKGLQFPIVFCPFLWSRNFTQHEPEEFFYHHSVPGGYEMRFHTGSENKTEALAQYRREQLAELLRLFYVALTRAKNYCSITWVELKDLQKTALGYLAGGYSEQELKHLFMERKIETSLENFYHWKGSPVIETTIPKTGEFVYRSSKSAPELVVPKMQHAIAGDWGLMSFSSLTAGKHAESEVVPGWDDEPEAEEPAIELELSVAPEAAPPFSDFPPGAVSGDCIHQIFEQLDFQSVAHPAWYDHLETRQMINGLLTAFGRIEGVPGTEDFEKNLKKRNYQVCSMIENVMRTPLQTPETTLRLCDIEQSSAISEMEFYFPAVEHLDFDKINALIGHISGKTGTLERGSSRTPLRGFMNGKIDLIFEHHGRFYVLDWKTNNLGISYQNYNRQALEKSMFDSNYLFQASIYSLALHKYLKARLPGYDFERNFGGVFYLYVRGMDGVSDENGVYFTRPDSKAVGLLENIFTEAGYE